MRKLSVHEIQQRELKILISFSSFCEENHLNYMLIGGTLLGAVRHQGFIPWDDDVDVVMPRPDYDRILKGENLKYQALEGYEICHWRNHMSAYPFIKIVDNHTTVHLKYTRDEMEVGGIWLDIFPLDGITENYKKSRLIYKKEKFYRRLLMLQMARMGEGRKWYKKCLKPIAILLLKPISHQYLCEKIDRLARTYCLENAEYAGNVVWGTLGERLKKSEYMMTTMIEFEGVRFKTLSDYEEYLRNKYGDYMKLPPPEKRETHSMEAYEN